MKAEDKHRWKHVPNPDKYSEYDVCLDCGCKRYKEWSGGYSVYYYIRSRITFGLKRPVCIKEEIESQKTID